MSERDEWAQHWPTLAGEGDDINDAEWEANMEFYARIYGGWRHQDTLRLVPFNGLLRDHNPGMLRAWRRWAAATQNSADESRLPGPAHALTSLAHYISISYSNGIEYLLRTLEPLRIRRAELLETLAFAGLHGGPRALVTVTPIIRPFLEEWRDPTERAAWPDDWRPDIEALRSGLDFDRDELLPGELERLRAWHLRHEGEVPAVIELLATHQPLAVKAFRRRWEQAYGGALPAQMPALFTLKMGVVLGQPTAIRRGVHHAIACGVSAAQVVQLVAMAQEWLGHAAIDIVADTVATALQRVPPPA